jgi:hypothetical protein
MRSFAVGIVVLVVGVWPLTEPWANAAADVTVKGEVVEIGCNVRTIRVN